VVAVALRDELEAALARFKLVEPVTVEDMNVIAKHLRFALGGDTQAEVFRNKAIDGILVAVWRDGIAARTVITPFTSPEDARAHGTSSRGS
jgi:hypothetical protein